MNSVDQYASVTTQFGEILPRLWMGRVEPQDLLEFLDRLRSPVVAAVQSTEGVVGPDMIPVQLDHSFQTPGRLFVLAGNIDKQRVAVAGFGNVPAGVVATHQGAPCRWKEPAAAVNRLQVELRADEGVVATQPGNLLLGTTEMNYWAQE